MNGIVKEIFFALDREGFKYSVSENEETSTVLIEIHNKKELQLHVIPTDTEHFVLIRLSAMNTNEHIDVNRLYVHSYSTYRCE